MKNYKDNLAKILEKVNNAAQKVNKTSKDIAIVAASKTRSIDEIKSILSFSEVSVAGENRVQEFISKYDEDVVFDFIGQLQTNKVKYIIDKVRMIHSVDRLNLVKEINKQAQKKNIIMDILIEVNSGREEAKGGVFTEEVQSLALTIQEFKNVRLRGLMAVAPIEEEDELRKGFDKVYNEFIKLKETYSDIDYLSMGMSEDYHIAIESGANMIRLGRILFD